MSLVATTAIGIVKVKLFVVVVCAWAFIGDYGRSCFGLGYRCYQPLAQGETGPSPAVFSQTGINFSALL